MELGFKTNPEIFTIMRKTFCWLIVWLSAMMCSAQIQVANTGNVGIGDTLTTDKKYLSMRMVIMKLVYIPMSSRTPLKSYLWKKVLN